MNQGLKVLITGATGMVGKGVLYECLEDERISEVLCIGRSRLGIQNPKLKEIILPDYSDIDSLHEGLEGLDACFMCMGVSAAGMTEKEYTKVTYDMTLGLAQKLVQIRPEMVLTYVSGQGTDATEKGRLMWARVKGRTENALKNLGFAGAYMFRPGVIIPERGIRSRTRSYQFIYDNFMWLIRILKKLSPDSIVSTSQLGQSMIQIALKGYEHEIIHPRDIHTLSKRYNNSRNTKDHD